MLEFHPKITKEIIEEYRKKAKEDGSSEDIEVPFL